MAEYHGSDIYCDLIIPRKLQTKQIKETANVLAFYHTRPFWPVHVVVTCKEHVRSLLELDDNLAAEMLAVVKEIAQDVSAKQGACRVLTNLGTYQDSKHLHIHISSGEPLNGT